MNKLEKTVLDSLKAAGVKTEDTLLVAVSGGADSTALLAALAAVGISGDDSCRRFRLNVLHINHALRGNESRADAAAVEALCDRLGVASRIISAPDGFIEQESRRCGLGIEAAARDFRHGALREEAERLGARLILIAHTRNDMLENTLLRILRGAGPAGLAAMPERNGKILRPLIKLERGEICGYLRKCGIEWREDSSNNDERFLRNRVRCRLVPLLDEHFPDWRKAIATLSETQALTAEFLGAEASRRINWNEEVEGKLSCALSSFAAESQIIREESLFGAHDRIGGRDNAANDGADVPLPQPALPRRAAIRDFASKIADGCTSSATQTLGGMIAESKNGKIIATPRKQKPEEECVSILINKPGLYRLKNFSIEAAGNGTTGSFRFIVRKTGD
ncbi:MAG: tRNA lysidine(34) synthetase TilS [Treponema sp.]|nr:tRNA lysidine(34) synthetase TilS [Treponema sp.]